MKGTNYNQQGVENLCNAIVEQAAEDFADAFMGKRVDNKSPGDTLRETDRFFHSDWYHELTNIDGDWLMKAVKIRELDKAIASFKRMLAEDGTIKFTIPKTKEKEGMNYSVPPRLTSEFQETIRYYITELEAEKEELLKED